VAVTVSGRVAADPKLLLAIVDVHDHRLWLGSGERSGESFRPGERQMNVAVTIDEAEWVKLRGLAVKTSTAHDPLDLRFPHREPIGLGPGGWFSRAAEHCRDRLGMRRITRLGFLHTRLSLLVSQELLPLRPRNDDLA
jgi:hypothetical protein